MAFGGFGKNSGPSFPPNPKPHIPFVNFPGPSQASSLTEAAQHQSPRLGAHADFLPYYLGTEAPQRMQSPPVSIESKNFVEGPYLTKELQRLGSCTDSLFDQGAVAQQKMQSPLLDFENNYSHLHHSFEEAQRPALSPPRWGNHPGLLANGSNSLTHQGAMVEPNLGSSDGRTRFPTKIGSPPSLKWTRSPPLPANEVFMERSEPTHDDSKRSNFQAHQRSLPLALDINSEGAVTKISNFHVPKRTRSPPLASADQVSVGHSNSVESDDERELQNKAKRLARFNIELNQTVQSSRDLTNHKFSRNRLDQPLIERKKLIEEHIPGAEVELPCGSVFPDLEGIESTGAITGLCADMCPESEREERERKGDLDKYERFDGDRNQTNKSLAVKKYNRTAEREADLIRPMPVLQKTVDYLLSLLDQPYDNRFLGMYNFLWDRMRAVRMDLRMQHIFNQGSITMLEQMIRLHIIAMHELCEYTKGEGFSEGFDAHLNIEQMNKTSVELFQMYDDHRKNGIVMPTEKEFRGYYALLKLDKHPGYKVEPAELSLDLAKMTTEIRQTPEVLFARDVARACRTGNFIAFFRLVRKATYLQACLMHAHFAKLRTQALASLHCGLQNNQGLPVAHVAKWLGMEEEDIESLLEYHGFSIKEFETSYMVKEGPLLNSDKDYPTKCSQIVHLKRSRRIIEDVAYSSKVGYLPAKEAGDLEAEKIEMHNLAAEQLVEMGSWDVEVDEDMPNFEADSEPTNCAEVQSIVKTSSAFDKHGGDAAQVAAFHSFSWGAPLIHHSPESWPNKVERAGKPTLGTLSTEFSKRGPHPDVKEIPIKPVSGVGPLVDSNLCISVENSGIQGTSINGLSNEESMTFQQENENEKDMTYYHDKETSMARLRLILRIWKRRSSKRKELRELRQLTANAALNLLSIGLPICQNREKPSTIGELQINLVANERREKRQRSWSKLNVSEVIGGTLVERNPGARCFCWKLLVCTLVNSKRGDKPVRARTTQLARQWLLSKLMAVGNDKDDGQVISSPGLSIWKKWVSSKFDNHPICCLSVIRDTAVGNLDDGVGGANAILFLVSDCISWELQKIQLHDLLMSLPSNSGLPLLILSVLCKEEFPDPHLAIVNGLGLNYVDRTKITSFSVLFLVGSPQIDHCDGFFSDDCLREGLQWLASQSPEQPVLRRTRARELVLGRLNSLLETINSKNVSEVGPNHCISVFNDALDQSMEEVANTANMNSACWPCPEIDLLEDSSDECQAVKMFLPSVGWSSVARIQPIIIAMKGCKLYPFPDDFTWPNWGTDAGKDIHRQKTELEKSLIRYLVESCKFMGQSLAAREACVMLQRDARLVLHNLDYYIVPRWVLIFRRIFNWRLNNLAFPEAYVLENGGSSNRVQRDTIAPSKLSANFNITTPPNLRSLDNLSLDDDQSTPYSITLPSLDEMVEVGCGPLLFGRDPTESEAVQPPPGTVNLNNGCQEASITRDSMEADVNLCRAGELAESNVANLSREPANSSSGFVVATKETKEADRLSKLLEQCNILQNKIDEKLSIYF